MADTPYEQRHRSHVRIWDATKPVGGGFVVGRRHIMTCAHVVKASLGGNPEIDDSGRPTGSVWLDSMAADDIPATRPETLLRARVVAGMWVDRSLHDSGDIAVLELCEGNHLPARAMPVVCSVKPDEGCQFSTYGLFADRSGPGAIVRPKVVEGLLQGPLGDRKYQLGSRTEDEAVRKGCSGAAVWMKDQGVVGMVVSWQQKLNGIMIPVSVLAEVYPDLLEAAAAPARFRSAEQPAVTGLSSRLRSQLLTFDREPQTNHFETALSKTWHAGGKPLLCAVAGVAADMPKLCRDRLRDQIGGCLEEQEDNGEITPWPLPWPETERFNVDDELEALKNGVKRAFGEKRSNDAATLRLRFNERQGGLYFYSLVKQAHFSRRHVELLGRWKDFWTALGAEPLNKPLAHIMMVVFPDQEPEDARVKFYERHFPSDDLRLSRSLPILCPFARDDVETWLGPEGIGLDAATIEQLSKRIREFPEDSVSRLAQLKEWVDALDA